LNAFIYKNKTNSKELMDKSFRLKQDIFLTLVIPKWFVRY
jgi:hypothetical protein